MQSVTVQRGTLGPPAKRLGIGALALLTLLTLLVGGLRFARIDLLGTSFFATDNFYTYETDDGLELDHLNGDIVTYLAMIEDRRGVEGAFYKAEPYESFVAAGGDVPRGQVAPFIHRPALPALAALLPLDAAYAWAAVNLGLIVIGLWAMVDALARQGRSTRAQLIGGLLYAVSLPMLVFASSLFIDGGTMAVFTIGYWLIVRRWWWAFAVFFPLSYAVKESMAFLAPAAVVAWLAYGRSWKDRSFIAGAAVVAVAFVAVAALVQIMAPEPEYSYNVWPKLSFLTHNLGSVFSTVFFIVGTSTVMVPATIAIVQLVRGSGLAGAMRLAGPELAGVATIVLVNIYSLVSTDLTLRTGWLIWPFAVSLTALLVDEYLDQRAGGALEAPAPA